MQAQTAYDRVDYPGRSYPQTHPDRLATLATLFGMVPADPARCRVLELGCGDGANLMPLAEAWPDSRYVGVDLAPTAVAKGRRIAERAGLANVSLHAGDIANLPEGLGEFDYVIAHGVYSWVPAPVREALLAACRRHLAPQGVAFVSYNVLPGGHARRMLREALLMHLEGIDEPHERTMAAREFLAWLTTAQDRDPETAQSTIAREARRLAARNDAGLFHDDLSGEFHLVHFRDFCEAAAAHDLQFLAEAEFAAMQDPPMAAGARATLDRYAAGLLEREQYRDFLTERRFRQTLLCHADVPLASTVDADRIAGLALAARLEPVGEASRDGTRAYRSLGGLPFETSDASVQDAVATLAAAWPRAIPLRELVGAASLHGPGAAPRINDFALATYAAGLVELHLRQPAFASPAGPRPRASALSRVLSADSTLVTGIVGNTVQLDDAFGRRVLALLDGTRSREDLARETGASPEAIERCVAELARCALLAA